MSVTVISEQKKCPLSESGNIRVVNTGNFVLSFKDPTKEEQDLAIELVMKAAKLPEAVETRRKYDLLTEDEKFSQLGDWSKQLQRWWEGKPDGYVGFVVYDTKRMERP